MTLGTLNISTAGINNLSMVHLDVPLGQGNLFSLVAVLNQAVSHCTITLKIKNASLEGHMEASGVFLSLLLWHLGTATTGTRP